MKIRKNLKGSGVSFGGDLCMEMRELQQEIKNHSGVAGGVRHCEVVQVPNLCDHVLEQSH